MLKDAVSPSITETSAGCCTIMGVGLTVRVAILEDIVMVEAGSRGSLAFETSHIYL